MALLLSLPWNPWSGSGPGVPRTQADTPSLSDLGGSSPALPFLALRWVGTEGSIEPSSVGVRTAEALGPLPF